MNVFKLRKYSFAFCFAILIAAPTLADLARADLVGLWEFDDATNLGKATIGQDLIIVGGAPAWSASMSDNTASQTTLNGVVTTINNVGTARNHFIATHGIGANGGGSNTNEYSLLFDIKRPTGNLWRSFYQTSLANNNDAEFFTRGGGGVVNSLGRATGGPGYSSSAWAEEDWSRIVISVDNGTRFHPPARQPFSKV